MQKQKRESSNSVEASVEVEILVSRLGRGDFYGQINTEGGAISPARVIDLLLWWWWFDGYSAESTFPRLLLSAISSFCLDLDMVITENSVVVDETSGGKFLDG